MIDAMTDEDDNVCTWAQFLTRTLAVAGLAVTATETDPLLIDAPAEQEGE